MKTLMSQGKEFKLWESYLTAQQAVGRLAQAMGYLEWLDSRETTTHKSR